VPDVRRLLSFPNPVNEVAARLVASGVVLLCLAILVTRELWLIVPLAYGFVARVLTGPRLSPLGLAVTRVVVPRLPVEPRPVPGPPKRFAQGIGALLSVSALVAAVLGASPLALLLVAAIAVAAFLEAAFAFCLGCKVFAVLVHLGVVPAAICAECADVSARLATAQDGRLAR
jgi:hypothetical protein